MPFFRIIARLTLVLPCFFTVASVAAQSTSYSNNSIPISGTDNAAFGNFTLNNTNTGGQNSAFGYNVMTSITSGSSNCGFGANALTLNTTGSNNTATGVQALNGNLSGSLNVAYGRSSLFSNNIGAENAAYGSFSMLTNTTGSRNTGLGTGALSSNADGNENTALGYYAMPTNVSGNFNSAIGFASMSSLTSGHYNVAVGYRAMYASGTGSFNTAVGNYSLRSNTGGNNNTAIGDSSGYLNSGSGNVFIGKKAGFNETAGSNKLYISNNISGTLLYGDFSSGQVLIGNNNPAGYVFKGSRKLNVAGGILTDSIRVSPVPDWADHVLSKDYAPMPLTELKDYIARHGHLPGIPMEAEVKKNGINLAEMNKLLLEKVEELTLYILQQQEIGQKQDEMIRQQNERIEKLEKMAGKRGNKKSRN